MKVWISLHSSYLESSFTGSLGPLLSHREGHILWFGKILKAFPIIGTSKYLLGGGCLRYSSGVYYRRGRECLAKYVSHFWGSRRARRAHDRAKAVCTSSPVHSANSSFCACWEKGKSAGHDFPWVLFDLSVLNKYCILKNHSQKWAILQTRKGTRNPKYLFLNCSSIFQYFLLKVDANHPPNFAIVT